MSGGSRSTLEIIDAVDAFANTLYVRTSQASDPALNNDVALAVNQLHVSLRHLRVEAAEQDSLLNSAADASLYVRQLRPLVEDCSFALKQLESFLDRYGNEAAAHSQDAAERGEKIAAIRGKLANEKTSVEVFLDTVQLHNPETRPNNGALVSMSSESSLEGIKDKLDVVAQKIFRRRKSLFDGEDHSEEDLWQELKKGLEMEGFSPQVLQKHKDILRAYVRELQSTSTINGGAPLTVRGLLEHEARLAPVAPKEIIHPYVDNEKCIMSMKQERRMPDHAPVELPAIPPRHSLDHYSSMSSEDAGSDFSDEAMALISTRDLMTMDSLQAGMANMQLQPHQHGQNYIASPRSSQKYLTSHVAGTLPAVPEAELSASPNSQLLGASPRYVPPPPGSAGTSPRLAPDRYGNTIPFEAQWTRIKRTIVSPEVLERAGVRYEARPDYVAVLGRLSREQIAHFARQSADCRAARSGRGAVPPRRDDKRDRADSKSSREEDDDDSVLWDESDTTDFDDDRTSEKGTKSYYIVDPPEKGKTSPNSATMPKPILKNKNENHVRFDPQPHEVESKSPRSTKDDHMSSRRKDSSSRRHRDSSNRDAREARYGDRRNGGSVGEKDRYGDYHRSSNRRERRGGDRRDRDRDKKKAWGETLGAVGIGGAAASLLSVLAEAAGGLS